MKAVAEELKSKPRILLRLDEAAEALALGRSTIYELVGRGELPVVRIGRAVRIPLTGLQAWVDSKIASSVPTEA